MYSIASANMLSLESKFHSESVLEALQNKTLLDILVVGRDNVSRHSDGLWILSPLVRSTLGSLAGLVSAHAQEPLLILPDFTHEDIDTALRIVEGNVKENLIFNSVTKDILETLGIHLSISAPLTMKTPYIRLKKVKVGNIKDSSDEIDDDDSDSDYEGKVADDDTDTEDEDYSVSDDEDENDVEDLEDVQKLFLDQNPDVDDSDEDDLEMEEAVERNIAAKRSYKVSSSTKNTANDSESSHDSDDNESSDDFDDNDDEESKSCDSDHDNSDDQSSDEDEVTHHILSPDLSSKLNSVDPLKKIKETIEKIKETIGNHDFSATNKSK